jgi:N-acetylmuramoyl-L-alanine amidase
MRKLILTAATVLVLSAPVYADYDTDLWYLSHVIQQEAGYCSEEMQEYVGSVVLNRLNDDRFPDSIPEVIEQPGQYATANRLSVSEPTQQVVNVAVDLLEDGSLLPADIIYQANYPLGDYIYMTLSTSYSVMYFCGG